MTLDVSQHRNDSLNSLNPLKAPVMFCTEEVSQQPIGTTPLSSPPAPSSPSLPPGQFVALFIQLDTNAPNSAPSVTTIFGRGLEHSSEQESSSSRCLFLVSTSFECSLSSSLCKRPISTMIVVEEAETAVAVVVFVVIVLVMVPVSSSSLLFPSLKQSFVFGPLVVAAAATAVVAIASPLSVDATNDRAVAATGGKEEGAAVARIPSARVVLLLEIFIL